MIYLGISEDKKTQLPILQALTRKFTLRPNTDLARVIALCPTNLTGPHELFFFTLYPLLPDMLTLYE